MPPVLERFRHERPDTVVRVVEGTQEIKVTMLASSDGLALLGKPMLSEPAVAALLQEVALDKPFPLL